MGKKANQEWWAAHPELTNPGKDPDQAGVLGGGNYDPFAGDNVAWKDPNDYNEVEKFFADIGEQMGIDPRPASVTDIPTAEKEVITGPLYEPDAAAFKLGGYDANKEKFRAQARLAEMRQAQQINATKIDPTQQDQVRRQQQALIGMLNARGGPSQAGQLGTMARERAMLQGPGGFGAGNEAAIQQAAQIRAGETYQAQQQALNLMGQGRTQDINLATSQATLGQQANMANQKTQLQQQGLNDDLVSYFVKQGYNLEEAQLGAYKEQERIRAEQVRAQLNAQVGIDAAANASESASKAGREAGIASKAGTLFSMFSDKNLKEDIKEERENLDEFMTQLKAYSYDYKDEKHGKGKRFGFLAQDAEKSKLGSEMIIELDEGKAVDINKGVSAALAGLSRLNERLKKLEG